MKIGIVVPVCSKEFYDGLCNKMHVKPAKHAQDFWSLMIKGISSNIAAAVDVFSSIPISANSHKKCIWTYKQENRAEAHFNYIPFINLPILRQICLFISTFVLVFLWGIRNRNEKRTLLCDVLLIPQFSASIIAGRILDIKIVGVINDIPLCIMQNTKVPGGFIIRIIRNIHRRLILSWISGCDGYVLQTDMMNSLLNQRNKPYIVVEGMVDEASSNKENSMEEKYDSPVIVCEGALHENNGVLKFIQAFINASLKDVELWVYGDGDAVQKITEIVMANDSIRFFGVVPDSVMTSVEMRAHLLVNLELSNKESTKYLFPSKIIEYMASGTPVLTTHLESIPTSYTPHLFTFEDESEEGMAETLRNTMGKPMSQLHEKGAAAKLFILNEKNNIIETKRILELLRALQ